MNAPVHRMMNVLTVAETFNKTHQRSDFCRGSPTWSTSFKLLFLFYVEAKFQWEGLLNRLSWFHLNHKQKHYEDLPWNLAISMSSVILFQCHKHDPGLRSHKLCRGQLVTVTQCQNTQQILAGVCSVWSGTGDGLGTPPATIQGQTVLSKPFLLFGYNHSPCKFVFLTHFGRGVGICTILL